MKPSQLFESKRFLQVTDLCDLQESLLSTAQLQCYQLVIVDINRIRSLDSPGLMAIVSAIALARQHNQNVIFHNASREIRMLFELAQLDQLCEIYEDGIDDPAMKLSA